MVNAHKSTARQVRPAKLSQDKVYEYLKKVEIDGLPRVRAYAEAIDPAIYELQPESMRKKLDYLAKDYPNFKEIREMVLAENQEWALRRSGAIQNKAIDLLSNLLDKANEIATNPDADAKDLNVAVSTLKSIMPAFTAIGNKASADVSTTDKTKRAAEFINVLVIGIIGAWIMLKCVA